MTLIDWLTAYLALGGLVALLVSPRAAVECSILTRFEQLLLFSRITLSWPTYLVEEYMLWKDGDED